MSLKKLCGLLWHFALTDDGDEYGIHDAGIETFIGLIHAIRELLQNSIDAALKTNQPVVVTFSRESIPTEDLPGIIELKDRFKLCKDYWKDDQDAGNFFRRAIKISSRPTIDCLRISDEGTTGVHGTDKDRSKGWFKLTRSNGSSDKGAQVASGSLSSDGGGSFGIGKRAGHANSGLRCTYYSTKTNDGKYSFIGTACLTTHEDADGISRQPKAYFGGEKGSSITDPSKIPTLFKRKDVGLDVLITAFDFESLDNWEDAFVAEVINNFWPAIHWGKVIVKIGDITIDNKTLPKLLEKFSGKKGFNAPAYYKAYLEAPVIERKLPRLQECKVRILAGDNFPKKVAFIRKNGMIIEERVFRSATPFIGVFECTNSTGNSLLRTMEPPRHDKWDPNRPSHGENTATEAEFKGFIYEIIRSLTPVEKGLIGEVTGLADLLPFDFPGIKDGGGSGTGNKGASKKKLIESPTATIIKTETPTPIGPPRQNKGKKKSKKKKKPTSISREPKLTARAIPVKDGIYEIFVKTKITNPVFVEVNIAGDDASNPSEISSITDESGTITSPIKGNENTFGPVSIIDSAKFTVELKTKRIVSLEVSGYEA